MLLNGSIMYYNPPKANNLEVSIVSHCILPGSLTPNKPGRIKERLSVSRAGSIPLSVPPGVISDTSRVLISVYCPWRPPGDVFLVEHYKERM